MTTFPRNFGAAKTAVLLTTTCLSALSTVTLTAQSRVTLVSPQTNGSDYGKAFAINALFGGVSAGLIQSSNGGSFLRGFTQGALGGGVVFAGKAVAGREFSGAGLVGRQLAGIGNSMVSNAASKKPPFSTLTIYLGPLPGRIFVTPGSTWKVRPVFDLVTAGATVYGAMTSYLDWNESWTAGAAVFRKSPNRFPRTSVSVQPNSFIRGATTIGGAIFITARGEEFYREILRHERIHVLQFDAASSAFGDRTDTWLFKRYPSFDRYVKTNFAAGFFGAVNQTMFAFADRAELPWEVEARLFSGY